VVLDLHAGEAKELADYLSGVDMHLSIGDRLAIARQIRKQVKPTRIPEPGLWAVVEASTPEVDRRAWSHHRGGIWIADGMPLRSAWWNELEDPTLIREGVA
jgi:hypothetical protein